MSSKPIKKFSVKPFQRTSIIRLQSILRSVAKGRNKKDIAPSGILRLLKSFTYFCLIYLVDSSPFVETTPPYKNILATPLPRPQLNTLEISKKYALILLKVVELNL